MQECSRYVSCFSWSSSRCGRGVLARQPGFYCVLEKKRKRHNRMFKISLLFSKNSYFENYLSYFRSTHFLSRQDIFSHFQDPSGCFWRCAIKESTYPNTFISSVTRIKVNVTNFASFNFQFACKFSTSFTKSPEIYRFSSRYFSWLTSANTNPLVTSATSEIKRVFKVRCEFGKAFCFYELIEHLYVRLRNV